MSKYNCDLDYLTPSFDISNEELYEIIIEADIIIKSQNVNKDTLSVAYLKKAQCLQKQNKFNESKEWIEYILQLCPDMPEALARLGNVYNLVEKKYEVAIEYINTALEKKPEYAYGYVMRGNAYLNKGELYRSIEDYSYAIKLKPDYAEAYVNRGGVYLFLCENDRVIADCNEAIRFKPNYAEAYVNRGNAYINKGEFDNAIADYNKASQLEPNLALIYYNRGVAYASRGEIDRAIADFSNAIQLQPDIVYMINDRGLEYGKRDKYEIAIAIFSVIIRLRPNYMDAINNRGIVFAKIKNYDNAIMDFNKAIQLVPNNASPYFNLGNIYADIGIYDKAILNFSIGLQIQPTNVEALLSRGSIYADNFDYNRAIADYTEVIRLKKGDAYIFYNRGCIYNCIKKYDNAILDFTEALHLGLDDEETYFSRGTAFAAKGDYDSAITDYEKVIQLKTDYVDAFFNKGNAYWGKGDHNKAIENYSKTIELQENHFGAFLHRGNMYEIKEEKDKALDDYSKALLIMIESDDKYIDPLNPKNIELFYYLADKTLPKRYELFWELPIDKLQNIPHFFIGIIIKFRKKGFENLPHKELIQAVYSIWQNCRDFKNDITVYQYSPLNVLDKMLENRRFHLKPASYQNDPEEGQVFYRQIMHHFKTTDSDITDTIETLSNINSETAAFIRSLTLCKNSLVMWNSSYGDNGNGISVGISAWKINRGQGIDKILINNVSSIRSSDFIKNKKTETGIRNNVIIKHNEEEVPLWKMGLYKILYVDENNYKDEFKDIIVCLSRLEKTDFRKEGFSELLGELFFSITHLIKDKAYEHEEEYRLLFIDSIKKEKKYIKTLVKNDICEGIYVETETVLFQDDKDVVFFGPKVPEVTINKYRHVFRLSGLPLKGSADKMLLPSGIHYR